MNISKRNSNPTKSNESSLSDNSQPIKKEKKKHATILRQFTADLIDDYDCEKFCKILPPTNADYSNKNGSNSIMIRFLSPCKQSKNKYLILKRMLTVEFLLMALFTTILLSTTMTFFHNNNKVVLSNDFKHIKNNVDCSSFMNNEHDQVSLDGVEYAYEEREKWLFGYNTRFISKQVKDEIMNINIQHNTNDEDEIEVKRGDLVLLCVHSVMSKKNHNNETTNNKNKMALKTKPFLRSLTKDDESRETLQNGFLVVGVMGARYAPDAVHGIEHRSLKSSNLVLLSSGGTYGKVKSISQPDRPNHDLAQEKDHDKNTSKKSRERVPVHVVAMGRLLNKNGKPFNIHDGAMMTDVAKNNVEERRRITNVPVIVFTGTSMNSGKSVSMSHFIRGLSNNGFVVGAAKVTGTDYPKDEKHYISAGASHTCTFGYFGFSSTHNIPEKDLDHVVESSITHLVEKGSNVVVLELADGVRAPDAMYLLGKSQILKENMTGVILAAQNGLSAMMGIKELERMKMREKLVGVTGLITSAPLAVDEFRALIQEHENLGGGNNNEVSVFSPIQLADVDFVASLITTVGFDASILNKITN